MDPHLLQQRHAGGMARIIRYVEKIICNPIGNQR
jgi:hypothetical protein